MQQFTRVKREATDDVGLALVVDAELFRLEGVVRWLDTADTRLRHDRPTTRRWADDVATDPEVVR
jgi:hypothetical protein